MLPPVKPDDLGKEVNTWMRILIAEDDFANRKVLFKFLSRYSTCDTVVDGMEAINAFQLAHKEGKPFDLICLDIMMPKVDGIKALKTIRDMEKQMDVHSEDRVKIIMTTALMETPFIHNSFDTELCGYYCKCAASRHYETNR